MPGQARGQGAQLWLVYVMCLSTRECTFPVFFNGFNVFNFFWSSALKLAVNISNDVQNRPQWVKNSEKLYGLSNVNNNIKMLLFLDGTGR